MKKSARKAIVAVVALLAVAAVPVAAPASSHAGGFGDWPLSRSLKR